MTQPMPPAQAAPESRRSTAARMRSLPITAKVQLVLLAIAIAAGVAAPYLLDRFLIGLMTLALAFAVYAMAVDLVSGYLGTVSLGHAGILAVSAYGIGYVAARQGGGIAQQLLYALLGTLIVSAVFAVMTMRTSGVYFIMMTLALGLIIWALTFRLSTITGAENGLRGLYRPGPFAVYWQFYWLVLAVTIVSAGLMTLIVRSPAGLAMKGIRESETRMQMLGYNTSLQKFYGFMLSGFFTGVAGVLFAYLNEFISPAAADLQMSAIPVLMSILGGIGTLVGPFIGAFIVVTIENLVSLWIDRWPTLMGMIFILVVLFARQGLVGAIAVRWFQTLARREHDPAYTPIPASALGDDISIALPKTDEDTDREGAVRSPGQAPDRSRPPAATGAWPDEPSAPTASSPTLGRALDIDSLTVQFGGVTALRQVSLSADLGERWAVIGPNGAGKTTLFRVISGEVVPTAGSVNLFGDAITGLPPYRRVARGIGRTYQITNTFPALTVEHNLAIAALAPTRHRFTTWWPLQMKGGLEERVARSLDIVGLAHRRKDLAAQLSHGEQRQLDIALALTLEPKVLLLDEPAAGLSGDERVRMREIIGNLPRHLCVVLIEHDMEIALDLADRVLCLADGTMVAQGSPAEIRADGRVQDVYLGRD